MNRRERRRELPLKNASPPPATQSEPFIINFRFRFSLSKCHNGNDGVNSPSLSPWPKLMHKALSYSLPRSSQPSPRHFPPQVPSPNIILLLFLPSLLRQFYLPRYANFVFSRLFGLGVCWKLKLFACLDFAKWWIVSREWWMRNMM